jgi:hypothetical protein
MSRPVPPSLISEPAKARNSGALAHIAKSAHCGMHGWRRSLLELVGTGEWTHACRDDCVAIMPLARKLSLQADEACPKGRLSTGSWG